MSRLTEKSLIDKYELIALKESGELCYRYCMSQSPTCKGCGIAATFQKLGEYEDKEENRKIVSLPYELGKVNKLYYIDIDTEDDEVYELDASHITLSIQDGRVCYTIDCYDFYEEDFDKKVFTNETKAYQTLWRKPNL